MSLFPSAMEILRREQELMNEKWWAKQLEVQERLNKMRYATRPPPIYITREELDSMGLEVEEKTGKLRRINQKREAFERVKNMLVDELLRAEPDDIDSNEDMIDRDDNKKKRREFDAIIRQRREDQRLQRQENTKRLGAHFRKKVEESKTLSNAIEKTSAGATHPQAMWKLK